MSYKKIEVVDAEEGVYVRVLPLGDFMELTSKIQALPDDGKDASVWLYVQYCLCDEHGNRKFTNDQSAEVEQLPPGVLLPAFEAAMKLNKVDKLGLKKVRR